jgi:hypothetical protein
LERAFAEAHVRRLTSRRDLLSLLARCGRRPGSPEIRRFLEVDRGAQLTRSQAEERFLSLLRAAQLPMPDVKVRIGPIEVDFLWREERLSSRWTASGSMHRELRSSATDYATPSFRQAVSESCA